MSKRTNWMDTKHVYCQDIRSTDFVSVVTLVIFTELYNCLTIFYWQLLKAKVFLVLDAKDGFSQVKLDTETTYLTNILVILWKIEVVIWNQHSTRRISKETNWVCFRSFRCSCGCWWSLTVWVWWYNGGTMQSYNNNNLHRLLERVRKIGLRFNLAKM